MWMGAVVWVCVCGGVGESSSGGDADRCGDVGVVVWVRVVVVVMWIGVVMWVWWCG